MVQNGKMFIGKICQNFTERMTKTCHFVIWPWNEDRSQGVQTAEVALYIQLQMYWDCMVVNFITRTISKNSPLKMYHEIMERSTVMQGIIAPKVAHGSIFPDMSST